MQNLDQMPYHLPMRENHETGDATGNLSNGRLFLVAMVLVMAIFVVDLFIPAGVLVPILYVIPLLISLWSSNQRHLTAVALLSALLTILAVWLSLPGGTPWMVYSNRGLALLTIGVMVLLSVLHRRIEKKLEDLHDLLPQCASCKKVRDDSGYWRQLELFLEEHHITQFSEGICPWCQTRYEQELREHQQSRNIPV